MENYNSYNSNIPNIFDYFHQFKPIHFKKGEMVFRPDMPNTNVFYIDKGYIKTYTVSANGDEKIIMFYKDNNVFPLANLFKGCGKSIFAETLTDMTLRISNEKDFENFLNQNKSAAKEFINYLLDYVEVYTQRIENLGFTMAYPRVLFSLLSLSKRFGIPDKNNIKVEIPITQRELAGTIAMTRETMSREFEKLVKEGIVLIKDHGIVIKDIKRLTKKLEIYTEIC